MSTGAEGLMEAMRAFPGIAGMYHGDNDGFVDFLRALVEHLGISWEMVEAAGAAWANLDYNDDDLAVLPDALATLLEAAGVER